MQLGASMKVTLTSDELRALATGLPWHRLIGDFYKVESRVNGPGNKIDWRIHNERGKPDNKMKRRDS